LCRLGYRLQLLDRSWQRLLVRLCRRRKLLHNARHSSLKSLHRGRELSDDSGKCPLRRLSYRGEASKRACCSSKNTRQCSRRMGNDFRGDSRQHLGCERRQKRQPDGIAKSVIDDFTHRLWILPVLGTIELSIRDFMQVSR
jgi:hypothetical protein